MGYMDLSKAEEKESETNARGKLFMFGSIILIVIACFAFSGGSLAGVIGMVGVFGFIAGFFMTFTNRNKGTILYEKEMALKQANLNIQMAKAGMNPYEVNKKAAEAQAAQKAETKEIIKGAVVGGIVAGEAGAVVGATIAKNKIDNKKNKV